MTRVLVPLGTRPEIVKLAPVVHALRGARLDVRVLATGQHGDDRLAGAFYRELDVRPDARWTLPPDEAGRVGTMVERSYRELAERRPDAVLLLGDTYTVPVFCLAARRHAVPVVHLEAGLRSFNPTSIEEVNRRVAGALASLHLAPTDLARRFLLAEGVEGARVRLVGNPVVDVLRQLGVRPRPVDGRSGAVVTAHRPGNVDDSVRLEALVRLVVRVAHEVGVVTFPVHPRTRQRLEATGLVRVLERADVRLLAPLPYLDMLDLLARSRVVITDSGGLQEEASWFGVPVVVLRRSTPRWEGVAAGTSVLVGLDEERAVAAAASLSRPEEQERVAAVPCPYGDGHTSERVAELLADPEILPLLSLEEPDLDDMPVPVPTPAAAFDSSHRAGAGARAQS